jgi:phosphatidylserine decarboxylase
MIVVKNIKYSLTEFLFGKYIQNYPHLIDPIYNENKKIYQITIYLSPGDCHRYYSPSNIHISNRIYLPGFLEPVKPSYIQKHPKVFVTNERVTLDCKKEGTNDALFITYVGALNVGSITLSFDDFLKTNQNLTKEEKENPAFFVLQYSDILSPGAKKLERKQLIYFKPKAPLLYQELEKDTEEFDIRDMLDVDVDIVNKYKIDLGDVKIPFHKLREKLIYEALFKNKEKLEFNYENSFKSVDLNLYKMKKKLSNPKELALENYKMSEKGIYLEKGEEMGWFNFGSTIVLVFSVDKEKNVRFKYNSGDVVRIGQSLYEYEQVNKNFKL